MNGMMVVMVSQAVAEKLAGVFPPSVAVSPGDTRLTWDPYNVEEVRSAQALFDGLKAKGFLGYKVTRGGDKGESLHTFDPAAEKIIMAPALRGG